MVPDEALLDVKAGRSQQAQAAIKGFAIAFKRKEV
jgi:hypothetical protein